MRKIYQRVDLDSNHEVIELGAYHSSFDEMVTCLLSTVEVDGDRWHIGNYDYEPHHEKMDVEVTNAKYLVFNGEFNGLFMRRHKITGATEYVGYFEHYLF